MTGVTGPQDRSAAKSRRQPRDAHGRRGAAGPPLETADDEIAYYETHSTVGEQSGFETVDEAALRVPGRRPRRRLISLRVFPHQLERIKRVAARQGMPYQTLIQLWLAQKLAEEDPAGGAEQT